MGCLEADSVNYITAFRVSKTVFWGNKTIIRVTTLTSRYEAVHGFPMFTQDSQCLHCGTSLRYSLIHKSEPYVVISVVFYAHKNSSE